jgi:hypothetical protein
MTIEGNTSMYLPQETLIVETFVPILCFPKITSQLEKPLYLVVLHTISSNSKKRGFGTFPTAIRSGPQQAHRILCSNRVVSIELQ